MSTGIVHKSGGNITAIAFGDLALEQPGIVKLELGPETVARFERIGDDLLLVLKDGRTLTLRNFFVVDDDGERSDLVLEDADGVMWWGQYTSPWSDFHFAEIQEDAPAAILPAVEGGLPAWAIAALALIGGGGLYNALKDDGTPGNDGKPSVTPEPPPNSAPTVPGYTHEIPEDTSVTGRVIGSDADGDALTYTKGSDPEHGTVVVNPDGSYTYTPDPDYHGPDRFTVIVDDGNGGTTTSTVDITVTPVNDPPTVPDYAHETPEDVPVTGQVTGSDIDGDTLTYTKGSDPEHGTVVVNPDGSYTYTPDPDYHGPDRFTVIVDDGNGGTTTSTVDITVTPVNDPQDNGPPTAPDYTHEIPEDTPVTGQVIGSDVDGDTLTYTKGSDPGHGTVVVNPDGSYTYTPDPDYHGPDRFTVIVDDGNGGTTTSTVDITVTPVNDPVLAQDDRYTGPEDTPIALDLLGNDSAPDGGLAIVAINGTALTGGVQRIPVPNGTVVVAADGSLSFVPAPNYHGPASFDYDVRDADGDTDTATVNITITPVNDPPTAPDYAHQIPEDTSVNGQVSGSDVDGDTLTYTKGSDPGHGTVIVNPDGSYTYTPDPDYHGPDRFTVIVDDGNGGTTTSTVIITVTPVNDPVLAQDDRYTGPEDTPIALNLLGNDSAPDGGLAIVAINGTALTGGVQSIPVPNGTVMIAADGRLSFVPAPDYHGAVSFDYDVRDADGDTDTATVDITITPVNDAPAPQGTIPDQSGEDAQAGVNVPTATAFDDVDGDVLEYSATGLPPGLTIDPVSGVISGTIDPSASTGGPYTVVVTATDPDGERVDQTFTWTVTNPPPVANDDTATTDEDTPVSGNVLTGPGADSDPDGDDLAVTRFEVDGTTYVVPAGGSATANLPEGTLVLGSDGAYTFTPAADYNGTVPTVTYTISDGEGGTDTATLIITVDPVNDPVVAQDDIYIVAEDTPVTLDLLDNDSAPDGGLDIVSINGTPLTPGTAQSIPVPNGTVEIDAGGTLTFVPAPDYHGPVSFDYDVRDADGDTDTATVDITVTPVNDDPVAHPDTGTVKESGVQDGGNTGEAGTAEAIGDVLANDTDVDTGDTLEVSGVSFGGTAGTLGAALAGTYGALVLNADGTYTYTLDNTLEATQQLGQGDSDTEVFTYTIVDADGATSTSTLTITVEGTNDRPVITSDPADAEGSVIEQGTADPDAEPSVGGTLTAADVDTDAELVWSIQGSGGGTYGAISIDPATGAWVYTLDNELPATQALNDGETQTETFTARVTDEHGAWSEQTITVTVNGTNDDLTGVDAVIELLEDPTGGAHTGTVQTHVTDVDDEIELVSFTVAGDSTVYEPGDTATIAGVGEVTIELDGSYTFTPLPNYSGAVPVITYTVQEITGGQQQVTQTLTFEITPVSDAPAMAVDKTLDVDEDGAIALDLTVPVITDAVDENGAGTGDEPERLGAITLTPGGNGAAGATFTTSIDGTPTTLVPAGGVITIVITAAAGSSTPSSLHATDQVPAAGTPGVYYLTAAEYAAIVAHPAAESHENFVVTVGATSYEVDASGAKRPDVAGAPSTQVVSVDVQAVTDPVELRINGSDAPYTAPAVDEDSTVNLKDYLSVVYGQGAGDANAGFDTDGSQNHWFTITGLPVGAVVAGVTIVSTDQVVTVQAPGLGTSAADLPDIDMVLPPHFSGDIDGIQITLNVQDIDSDGPSDGVVLSDTVELNLRVNPVANDVRIQDPPAGNEDSAIAFLARITMLDTSTDSSAGGQEIMTALSFTLPAGFTVSGGGLAWTGPEGVWTMTAPAGVEITVSGNTITITADPAGGDIQALLGSFAVTPPDHSSKDLTLEDLQVTTLDTATVGGSQVDDTMTTPPGTDLTITVIPVAETTTDDTGGASGNDVTMNGNHTYAAPLAGDEDAWFALGTDTTGTAGGGGFALGADWSNEDTDEFTFAVLTPVLVSGTSSGDSVDGAMFRYHDGAGWVEQTYTGAAIWVPSRFLDSLQFKGPADVAGDFSVQVRAATVDYDDDADTTTAPTGPVSSGPGVNVQISGNATLDGIRIDPVADQVTLGIGRRITTDEDTPVALRIEPRSDDPGETFNVTLSGIPDGASISYGGVVQTIIGGVLTIEDFDKNAPLLFTPPQDSNASIALTVTAQAVDGADLSDVATASINITVNGVPDTPAVVIVEDRTYVEDVLDATGNTVALSDLVTNVASGETSGDGSETVTLRISGLPEGVTLLGAGHVLGAGASGEDRVWVVSPAQIADGSVQIRLPANYSGTIDFTVQAVVTESDNPSRTFDRQDVSFTITPSPEATLNIVSEVQEDSIGRVDLTAAQQNGDGDETISAVRFRVAAGGEPVEFFADAAGTRPLTPGGDGWYDIEGVADVASVYVKGPANFSGEVALDVEYKVTDPSQDGTLPAVESGWQTGDHTLVFLAVTDAATAQIDAIEVAGVAVTGHDVGLTSPGTVTVTVDIGKAGDPAAGDARDVDGSEVLTHLLIRGVPEGVLVQGAQYVGAGEWLIVTNQTFSDADGIQQQVVFEVTNDASAVEDASITMTAYTRDLGESGTDTASDLVQTAEVVWTLNTDFAPGNGGTLPSITLQIIDTAQTEDHPFALSDVVGGNIDTAGATENEYTFSITLRASPDDETTFGPDLVRVEVMEDGQPVVLWIKTVHVGAGDDAQALLQDALDGIQVIPPANANGNPHNLDGGLPLNVTVTLYGHGLSNRDQVQPEVEVQPVTDPATVSISAAPGEEGQPIDITVTIGNASDAADDWSIVGGRLYLQLDGTDIPGTLTHGGNPLAIETDPAGLPPGLYYVIDGVQPDAPLQLVYTPTGEYDDGSVQLRGWVFNQENGSTPVLSSGEQTLVIAPTNSGPRDMVATAGDGTEHDGNTLSLVEVRVTGEILPDAAETLYSAFLQGLPSGFAVYYGNDAGSAVQASNAGNDGAGGNTWSIPLSGGGLPAYIGIQAPAHWSGTLEDLQLYLVSGEGDNAPSAWPVAFDLNIAPVADGLTLAPTLSFGTAGQATPIVLNLNAALVDPVAVAGRDGHRELATLELTGFPPPSADPGAVQVTFHLGDTEIDAARIQYADGKYIVAGLSQEELDQFGFHYANGGSDGVKQITITAWTQEYAYDEDTGTTGAAVGDPSESVTATMNINVAPPVASGDAGMSMFFGWNDEIGTAALLPSQVDPDAPDTDAVDHGGLPAFADLLDDGSASQSLDALLPLGGPGRPGLALPQPGDVLQFLVPPAANPLDELDQPALSMV